jgi:hypothetical protein
MNISAEKNLHRLRNDCYREPGAENRLLNFSKVNNGIQSMVKENKPVRHSGLDPESRGCSAILDPRVRGNDEYCV